MDRPLARLIADGIDIYEASFTALDAYHGLSPAPIRFIAASCSLVELARKFDRLEYPGLPYADAALSPPPSGIDEGPWPVIALPERPRHPRDRSGASASQDTESATTEAPSFFFRCVESLKSIERSAFPQLDLLREPRSGVFFDPQGIYPWLRKKRTETRVASAEEELFQAVVLASRYAYEFDEDYVPPLPRRFEAQSQRNLLALLLPSAHPERGLELLRRSGFLEAFWPELDSLAGVGQAKEHHPEGDAWQHTLETFQYRKAPELRLSLALLLHDAGKPRATPMEGRKFDRHAEIGGTMAERFLRGLGYPEKIISDVSFLVRYHMMPAALPRLPYFRTRHVVEDSRFPLLLELYKCDEFSTFRGPDAYYEACAAYRAILKNSKNPFRDPEGRKLAHIFLGGEL